MSCLWHSFDIRYWSSRAGDEKTFMRILMCFDDEKKAPNPFNCTSIQFAATTTNSHICSAVLWSASNLIETAFPFIDDLFFSLSRESSLSRLKCVFWQFSAILRVHIHNRDMCTAFACPCIVQYLHKLSAINHRTRVACSAKIASIIFEYVMWACFFFLLASAGNVHERPIILAIRSKKSSAFFGSSVLCQLLKESVESEWGF